MQRVGELEALAPLRVGQQILDGGAHGRVRQFGQPAGDLHHRPHAADVGDTDEQRGLRLHAAKQPHGVRLVLRRRDRPHRFVEGFVETVVGIGFEQRDKPLRLLTGEVPEIGRPFGQGRKESTHGRMVGQQSPERVAGRRTGQFVKPFSNACMCLVGRKKLRRSDDTLRKRIGHADLGIF